MLGAWDLHRMLGATGLDLTEYSLLVSLATGQCQWSKVKRKRNWGTALHLIAGETEKAESPREWGRSGTEILQGVTCPLKETQFSRTHRPMKWAYQGAQKLFPVSASLLSCQPLLSPLMAITFPSGTVEPRALLQNLLSPEGDQELLLL